MAELIIPMQAFRLTSIYMGTSIPEYLEATTAVTRKRYDLSLIPYGSTINAAVLRVDATAGYSGGTLRINGSTDRAQTITDLIRPNSVGNYTSLEIEFTYKAYGNIGGSGIHYSTCNVTSAEIVIDYTPGEGTVTDPEAYRAASLATTRTLLPRAVIVYPSGARQPISSDQIISYTINEGVKNGVLLGAVTSSVLNMRLANDMGQWLPGGSMRGTRTPLGAKMLVEVGITIDGEYQYQPAGAFEIDKFQAKDGEPAATFSGFDAMGTDMEEPYIDGLTYPATLAEVLTHISEQSGIGYVGALAANRGVTIPSRPEWGDNCTLRQALSWVCQAGASYGQINRSGILAILPTWRTDEQLALLPEHCLSSVHDERVLKFNRVKITPTNNDDAVSAVVDSAIGETTANTIPISNNPLITDDIAQTIADGIRDALSGATWRVADVRWRGDPSVTIGCRMTVTERSGELIETTITSQNIKWDKGLSMTGRCEIDIGRAFADLGYDTTAIGGLPAGTRIRITEAEGDTWYTLVSVNYGGLCLLLRDEIYKSQQYYLSTPGSATATKYAGSSLDTAMTTFYDSLPEAIRALVAVASVPVRDNASSGAAAVLLQRNAFALSATELGLNGSTMEGESLPYLGTVAASDIYWTREPVGGLTGYAYSVSTTGTRRNDTMITARGMRPAMCLYTNTAVYAVDGGFAPDI